MPPGFTGFTEYIHDAYSDVDVTLKASRPRHGESRGNMCGLRSVNDYYLPPGPATLPSCLRLDPSAHVAFLVRRRHSAT